MGAPGSVQCLDRAKFFLQVMMETAAAALAGWKSSAGHDQMILNKYAWKRMKWNAMGVGIYGHYAVVWFGEEADPAGKVARCP